MPQESAPTTSRMIVACILLLTAIAVRLPTLGQPLTEAHAFRQTQTAFTALIYHQEGIDVLRPQVPVFGPPWVLPFEFPITQVLGALLMGGGLEADPAMRVAGLVTFLLSATLLYALTRRIAGSTAAIVALAAFLFSPFGMLWSRTSMIEYAACAGGLGFLFVGTAWLDRRTAALYAGALIAGSVAMLVKPTTAIIYLIPLLAWVPSHGKRPWLDWRAIALIAVPVVLGIAWTTYADALKSSVGLAGLTSGALRDWYFGEVADRLDWRRWAPILGVLMAQLSGMALIAWLALGAIGNRGLEQRRLVNMLALCAGGVILVVFPLYFIHDYYLAAVSPVLALLIGIGSAWLWERRKARAARAGMSVLAALWIAAAAVFPNWTAMYLPVADPDHVLPVAQFVRERSGSDDLVAVIGRSWSPAVHYYARRRGLAFEGDAPWPDLSRYDLVIRCANAQCDAGTLDVLQGPSAASD